MLVTDFSPYLENGLLDLNKAGNKFSSGKGQSESEEGQSKSEEGQSKSEEVKFNCFKDIFDIGRLAEFIKTTPGITEFKAAMWGIGEMGIDNFRLLINAIKESKITAINFENNSLTGMAKEISELTKLIKLNLGGCSIGDEEITKIVEGLPKILVLNVENNGITDTGIGAIVEHLPNLLSLNASCNCITDIGADNIKCFKGIKEISIAYCNNISCEELQEIVEVHRKTLTKVDLFSSVYTSQKLSKIVELLLPDCVVTLGSHWTKGVNHINDAPLPLVGAVWANNNAPPLIVPVGENNDALPLVGVAGDILEG